MPKKVKKAGGAGGRKGDDGSLDVQQNAQTWETARKEALLKEIRQRAHAEEERARQKEKILRDKLQKEERNSAKNLLKINAYWMRIFEQAQSAEQKEEISVMKAVFEREVEELDSIIKDLERKRQEQERRSAHVRHDHQQQMERLCDLNEKRLILEHQQWGSRMLNFDRTQKIGHSEKQHAELDSALYAMQEEQKEVTTEILKVYQEALQACDESLFVQGDDQTLERKKLEEDAKKGQRVSQLPIEIPRMQKWTLNPSGRRTHMKTEQELQEAVARLKNIRISRRSEQEQQEQELIAACDQVHRDTLKLRGQLSKNRTAARKKITDLSLHSDAASKKLKALIAKGERIVQKGKTCRKLESKVLSLLPQEIASLGAEAEEAAGEVPELQNLMRRINTATLQGDALKKRRRDLIRENQELERQLRQLRESNSPQLSLSIGPTLLAIVPAPHSQTRANAPTGHAVSKGVHIKRPRN